MQQVQRAAEAVLQQLEQTVYGKRPVLELVAFREPVGSLTGLYVKAAYSGQAMKAEEGKRAVEVLRDVSTLGDRA